MWTMGKDNGYAFADLWYSNMDKLIQIMNEHERNDFKTNVSDFHSTPCVSKNENHLILNKGSHMKNHDIKTPIVVSFFRWESF